MSSLGKPLPVPLSSPRQQKRIRAAEYDSSYTIPCKLLEKLNFKRDCPSLSLLKMPPSSICAKRSRTHRSFLSLGPEFACGRNHDVGAFRNALRECGNVSRSRHVKVSSVVPTIVWYRAECACFIMSIVDDRIRQVDTVLDRIQIYDQPPDSEDDPATTASEDISGDATGSPAEDLDTQPLATDSARILKLKSVCLVPFRRIFPVS